MEIIFILTEPAVPENIGAAARAIKTMGFHVLRLVNPANHLADEARWLAHGSAEILEQAQVFNSFTESIRDLDFVMATTAKQRSAKFDYYTPEEAKSILSQKSSSVERIGIVFGREESGLTNEELAQCDLAVTIPMKISYPSVNLAQAVMIMAYEFSDSENISSHSSNKQSNYPLLKTKVIELLSKLGILADSNLHGRIMERFSLVGDTDVNLLLSIFSKLENKLRQNR